MCGKLRRIINKTQLSAAKIHAHIYICAYYIHIYMYIYSMYMWALFIEKIILLYATARLTAIAGRFPLSDKRFRTVQNYWFAFRCFCDCWKPNFLRTFAYVYLCVCALCGKIEQSRQALCGAGRQPRHVLRYLDCCCCFCFLISWFIDYRIERHAYEIVNSKQIVVGGLHYNNYK